MDKLRTLRKRGNFLGYQIDTFLVPPASLDNFGQRQTKDIFAISPTDAGWGNTPMPAGHEVGDHV